MKERLGDQAGIQPGQRTLDVGWGTGTLGLLIKSKHHNADVIGLGPDPEILAIAKQKASKSGAGIRFDVGYADQLPYPDSSFDRVVSNWCSVTFGMTQKTGLRQGVACPSSARGTPPG